MEQHIEADELGPGQRVETATDDDVRRIRKALLLLVTAAEKITALTAESEPPEASAAGVLWHGAEHQLATDGFILMQFANLSAFDHVRGFVELLAARTTRSTVLATIARGSFESFARTWHLLQHPIVDDFNHAVLSFLHDEMAHPQRLQEPLHTRNGDVSDAGTQRRLYADELTRLGLPKPSVPGPTKLTAALLDAATDTQEGALHYSALSSVAHGHRLGVNTFITTDASAAVVGLVAPRQFVVDIAATLIAVMFEHTDQYVRFYGQQPGHMDRLRHAVSQVAATFRPVEESVWGADTSGKW